MCEFSESVYDFWRMDRRESILRRSETFTELVVQVKSWKNQPSFLGLCVLEDVQEGTMIWVFVPPNI